MLFYASQARAYSIMRLIMRHVRPPNFNAKSSQTAKHPTSHGLHNKLTPPQFVHVFVFSSQSDETDQMDVPKIERSFAEYR